jgi:hypothetical protein
VKQNIEKDCKSQNESYLLSASTDCDIFIALPRALPWAVAVLALQAIAKRPIDA